MKLRHPAGYSTIQLKIQDATGHNVMVNRDVLRRTYTAIKVLARHFYVTASEPDSHRPPFAISFIESQNGSVLFNVDLPDHHRGRVRGPVQRLFYRNHPMLAMPSTQMTAGTALRNTVLLAHAASFVLEGNAPRRAPTTTPGLTDLSNSGSHQRVRVPNEVADALGEPHIRQALRELFVAVREEGVASVVIGMAPDTPERRVEFVIPAADDVIRFVEGGPLATAGF